MTAAAFSPWRRCSGLDEAATIGSRFPRPVVKPSARRKVVVKCNLSGVDQTAALGPKWRTRSAGAIPPLQPRRGARLNSPRRQPTFDESNDCTESGDGLRGPKFHLFAGGGPVSADQRAQRAPVTHERHALHIALSRRLVPTVTNRPSTCRNPAPSAGQLREALQAQATSRSGGRRPPRVAADEAENPVLEGRILGHGYGRSVIPMVDLPLPPGRRH